MFAVYRLVYNSFAKLDLLEVKMLRLSRYHFNNHEKAEDEVFQIICNVLNRLHQRGFYEQLHFYMQCASRQYSD